MNNFLRQIIALGLLSILNSASGQTQVDNLNLPDTTKWYYQNGQLHSESVSQNKVLLKRLEYYYPNGELKSKTILIDIGEYYTVHFDHKGAQTSEFSNSKGIIHRSRFQDNQLIYESYTKDSMIWEMNWYSSGGPKSFQLTKKGYDVYCFSQTVNDHIISACYCGNTKVVWQDSLYLSLTGEKINLKYSSLSIDYYENGLNKRRKAKDYRQQHIQEWGLNGDILTDTLLTSNEEFVLIGFDRNSSRSIISNVEGGPLLKTPNPLRDTIIRSFRLKYLEEILTTVNVYTTYYDSLAREYPEIQYISVNKVDNDSLFGIPKLKYCSEYTFYIHGNESLGLLVGLSKSLPRKLIFHSLKEKYFYQLPENVPILIETD